MCKLIVGVKKEGKNTLFKDIIDAQRSVIEAEKDGIGVFIANRIGQFIVARELTDYQKVFDILERNMDSGVFFGIHTRSRSSGKVDSENIHFFNDEGYYFAHNGFVQKYHKYQYAGYYPNEPKHTSDAEDRLNIDEPYAGGYYYDENEGKMKPKPKGLESFNYVSEIIADCFSCGFEARICSKHADLKDYLYDDSAEYFNNLTEIKAKNPDETKKNMELAKKAMLTVIEIPKKKEKNHKHNKKKKTSETCIDDMCDSFQFLKNLPKPITNEALWKACEDDKFSGMGLLIDTLTEGKPVNAKLIIEKQCYSLSDKNTFGLFFSYEPEKEVESIKFEDVFGVPVLKEERKKEIKLPHRLLGAGIHDLNYTTLCGQNLKQ